MVEKVLVTGPEGAVGTVLVAEEGITKVVLIHVKFLSFVLQDLKIGL